MLRVLTAVILGALVLLLLFKAPIWLFCLIVGLIALLATHEYLNLVAAHDLQPLRAVTLIAVGLQILNIYLSIYLRTNRTMPTPAHGWRTLLQPIMQYQISSMLVSLAPFVLLVAAMRIQQLRQSLPSAATSYLAVPYIALTLSYLIVLRGLLPNGALAIFYLLVVVWVGDIFAYYIGRFAGKHPMAPVISPNKTWEGAAASVIASMIAGTLLLVYNARIADFASAHGLVPHPSVLFGMPRSEPNPVWIAVIATIGLNIAAQLGDLVESMIKRGANQKDSGAILPGHGGIFDRIDALLLATPVLWYYASFGLLHF